MLRALLDLVRGAMIGVVEIIPGVSGGTIALIVGVYDDIITSIGHLVRALVGVAVDVPRGRGTARAREHLTHVRWRVLVPVAIGMVTAVVVAARLLAPLIESYPVETRALFMGLIVASIAIPARMVGGRWQAREYALAGVAAVAAFFLTGIRPLEVTDPPMIAVALAAAVAVCALAVPGLSGSFVLLVLGLYAPTLAALNDRDLGYIGVFLLGAAIGFASFVSLLQWLLEHRRRTTLAIMTGLMVGSLRALWPWQADDATLLAPSGPVALPVTLFVVGLVAVVTILLVEAAVHRRRARLAGQVADDPQVLTTR